MAVIIYLALCRDYTELGAEKWYLKENLIVLSMICISGADTVVSHSMLCHYLP